MLLALHLAEEFDRAADEIQLGWYAGPARGHVGQCPVTALRSNEAMRVLALELGYEGTDWVTACRTITNWNDVQAHGSIVVAKLRQVAEKQRNLVGSAA